MTEEISRVVALAWGAEVAPQRGPKRELTLERIVEAAIEIADDEGLPAVTMQRVAQTFGYTTMAMYRYVANKDELYRLMFDAAGGGAIAVDDEDWRVGLQQLCAHLLEVYRQHPWLLDIPISLESLFMPEQVRFTDAALRALRTLRIGPGHRLLLLMSLSTFVRGHASLMREITKPDARVGEETMALVREAVTAGGYPDLAPLVESGAYMEGPGEASGGEAPLGNEFDLSLRIWLEGISAVYEAETSEEQAAEQHVPQTPEILLKNAEHELSSVTQLRKATQRRVRELEKREAAVRKKRDAAKEAAKAAAKAQR